MTKANKLPKEITFPRKNSSWYLLMSMHKVRVNTYSYYKVMLLTFSVVSWETIILIHSLIIHIKLQSNRWERRFAGQSLRLSTCFHICIIWVVLEDSFCFSVLKCLRCSPGKIRAYTSWSYGKDSVKCIQPCSQNIEAVYRKLATLKDFKRADSMMNIFLSSETSLKMGRRI